MKLKSGVPTRGVTEIGPGDYVKIGSSWQRVTANSAHGAEHTPREWTIHTETLDGVGMYQINRYAKAEDLE